MPAWQRLGQHTVSLRREDQVEGETEARDGKVWEQKWRIRVEKLFFKM